MTDVEATTERPAARKRKWLRRVRTVVLCLLAGAIINVLVAWGCAYWSVGWDLQYLSFLDREAAQAEVIWLDDVFPLQDHEFIWTFGDVHGFGFERVEYFPHSGDLLGAFPPAVGVTRAGWPLHSVWSFDVLDEERTSSWECVYRGAFPVDREVEIPFMAGDTDVFARPIPFLPIWAGFLTNTVFYGAILWMLFAAKRAVQSHRRTRRGLCPGCAYDLRGAAHAKCPECGDGLTNRQEQQV